MNDLAISPFAHQSDNVPAVATARTEQSRAIAEVQAGMVIAKTNPRNQIAAMDRILNACTRPTLADSALYSYSRGGSDITGPSIRLAEAMAQSWGNVSYGIRELEQRDGESSVQAYAWDLETNTRREMTFQIPHVRHTRTKVVKLTDPRDIYEMVANNGARRLRACIIGIIPGDVTEAAVAQCEATMRAKADTSPEGMKKMLEAFEPYGVKQEHIEKRIQRRMDAIQPAQVVALKKIYSSLRDGMSKTSDWFEIGGEDGPSTTLADIKGKAAAKAKEKPAADTFVPPTFAQVMQSINAATNVDLLDLAADTIGEINDAVQYEELMQAYRAKRESLGAA